MPVWTRIIRNDGGRRMTRLVGDRPADGAVGRPGWGHVQAAGAQERGTLCERDRSRAMREIGYGQANPQRDRDQRRIG